MDIQKAHKSPITKLHEKKAQVDDFNKTIRRKSMIRYLTIIIDFSRASLKQDLRPNRARVTQEVVTKFMLGFVDQNPLSKLSLIVTMRQRAICISDFDQPINVAIQSLRQVNDFDGNPSYQNALEIANQ